MIASSWCRCSRLEAWDAGHQVLVAAAALAVLSSATIAWRTTTGPHDVQTAQPPRSALAEVTLTPSGVPGNNRQFTASGCAFDPLAKDFADARAVGASVITGRGVLTGKTSKDLSGVRYEMTLTDLRTLAGPVLPDGTTLWILASPRPAGSTVQTDQGPLWGPDGALFAIYYPPSKLHKSTIVWRQAPIVDGQVILSASGCWSPEDLHGKPFHGPLTEIAGTNAYNGAAAQPIGLTAVPLSTIERLAKHEQR